MDRDDKTPRKRPEPLLKLFSGLSVVELYDFTQLTRSNPPALDDDPILLPFPDRQSGREQSLHHPSDTGHRLS